MKKTRKLTAVLLIFAFFALSSKAKAEDLMQTTFKDAMYGGLIGALLGSALVLLTDNPDDHLGYIPTGAGVGILVGAAYGLGTSGIVQSAGAAEVTDGKLTFNMPTVERVVLFDNITNTEEVIQKLDLLKVNF